MAVVAPIRERRFHPRVGCHISDSCGQVIRNVSQSGLYLETVQDYETMRLIPVSFSLPPEGKKMDMDVKVMRKETLTEGFYGYGLCFKDLSADDFRQIQYFILYRTSDGDEEPSREVERRLQVFYKTISVQTKQQNLASLDPRLAEHLRPTDYFSVHNLTREIQEFVRSSGIRDGNVLIQTLHTSATLAVNELDEPMLLMDLVKKLRAFVPKDADYFHNGPLRKVNVCTEDNHCDRNGDAHLKATLFGRPSVNLIIKDGELLLGHWQKVVLLEFDGPRRREVFVQGMGG